VGVEHQTPLWRMHAHFLVRAPAHGRAAEAYGTDVVDLSLPRSSVGCFVRSRSSRWRIRSTCCRDGLRRAMCAIEAGRTRRPSHLQYHTRHSSLGPRAVPPVARSLASLVPWFRDGSGMGVEPTLRESSQDRRFDWSKPGAGHLQAGQHVVGSDQRCLMRQRHG
jgi:hypothetical protein